MNLSRCEQGHFFDKEKNATCPYCAQGAQQDDSLTALFTEDLANTVPVTEAVNPGAGQPEVVFPGNPGYGGMPQAGGYEAAPAPQAAAAAQPAPVLQSAAALSQTSPLPESFGAAAEEDEDDDHTIGIFDGMFGEPEPVRPAPPVQPLQQAQATASSPAPSVTPPPMMPPRSTSPCTGWLVSLGGAHTGIDFRLKAGKNFVGRSADMDVALVGDKSVSRNKHAIVVYEPKQHLYLIQPGESSELVYLNDAVVLSPMQLTAYDIITVGEVQLLFIPLCGEKFSWSELSEKRK